METFLFVLLLILKIIGIILLALIGLILLVLILILFVPFRYKGEGYYKDGEYDFKAKVTFLLHAVSVCYDINAEENIIIKIFGIKYKLKQEETEEASAEHEKPPASEENKTEEDLSKPDQAEQNISKEDEAPKETIQGKEDSTEEKTEQPSQEDKNIKKQKKKSTNKEIYAKIKEYIAIAKSEDFRNTLSALKKLAISGLKAILPKKWEASGKVGFEDAYTNGQVCAVIGALYPILYKHSTVYCDFEQPGIDVSGWFKGRIFAITFVFLIGRLYLNKSVRKMVKFVIKNV